MLTSHIQGMPDNWKKLYNGSGISKEEAQKNPKEVLLVLGYYTTLQSNGLLTTSHTKAGQVSAPKAIAEAAILDKTSLALTTVSQEPANHQTSPIKGSLSSSNLLLSPLHFH